jgi:hypothetical protein
MKGLDQRLSEVVSPFEENEQDQSEITAIQYLQFRKDSLIDGIGKISGFQEFDLFLEEVLQELDSDETILFLSDCVTKLGQIYPLDVLVDYIGTDNILENDPDSIISLLKFFVYNEWFESIVPHLPVFEIKHFNNRLTILTMIKEAYLSTQEEIIKGTNIHPLVQYLFKYCPRREGENLLAIFVFKDISGIVSRQLVNNTGDTDDHN